MEATDLFYYFKTLGYESSYKLLTVATITFATFSTFTFLTITHDF